MDFDVMELELQGPYVVSSDNEAARDGGLGLDVAAAGEAGEAFTDSEPGLGVGAVGDEVPIHEVLEAMICAPMQTPILCEGPRPRRSRTPISINTLRHSGRLAIKPRAANSTRQAQNVLMKKLGMDVDITAVDSGIKRKFKAAFSGPISARKQQAL